MLKDSSWRDLYWPSVLYLYFVKNRGGEYLNLNGPSVQVLLQGFMFNGFMYLKKKQVQHSATPQFTLLEGFRNIHLKNLIWNVSESRK